MNTPIRPLIPAIFLLIPACLPLGGPPKEAEKKPLVTDETKEAVRRQEEMADRMEEQQGNAELQQIERMEADLVKALKGSLGQQAPSPGLPPPEPSSAIIEELTRAKIKLRLEPVVDQEGRPVNDHFLQLKDSFTDRVQVLSRKMSEGKATAAEKKEMQEGARHVGKINDLRTQVMNLSMVTMSSNSQVQTSSMTTLLRAAGMVRTRKMMEMELNEADHARAKKWLERQRRSEAVAATSLGMLAAYQAVLNQGGDPKALSALAEQALKGLEARPEVSEQEVKDYLGNLGVNVAQVKARYEEMMRKIHGDAKYERQYKAGIDAMFRQAEGADNQKSVTQMAEDTQKKYNEDLERCGRGEAIDPGSLVSGPTCKEARKAQLEGRPLPRPGQAASGGGGVVESLTDKALGMIPGIGTIKNSLEGVQALARGDTKGALQAAIGMIPGGGPIKEGLGLASKLLFKE
jgi:hypothetical protein